QAERVLRRSGRAPRHTLNPPRHGTNSAPHGEHAAHLPTRGLRLTAFAAPAPLAVALALALLAALPGRAAAQPGPWELVVCADSDNLPYSNRAGEGFENRIAQIIADQVGAEFEYVWLPHGHAPEFEVLQVRSGACDLVLGVPDGVDEYLSTIAYYRSTTVFVARG